MARYGPQPRSLEDRFWEKVDRGDSDGCWIWTAGISNGYGQISDGSRADGTYRNVFAHRASYELNVGAIPDGKIIHHVCANRLCVRPDHLEVTTPDEHADAIPSLRRAKTHCPQGHPYDGPNLYVTPDGGRQCRECNRRRGREWYQRNQDRARQRRRDYYHREREKRVS